MIMEIDRNDEMKDNDATSEKRTSSQEDQRKASNDTHFTEVENAHASGLGSMGRSDEKLMDKERRSKMGDNAY
jgi:hypothetical protein